MLNEISKVCLYWVVLFVAFLYCKVTKTFNPYEDVKDSMILSTLTMIIFGVLFSFMEF